MYTKIHTIYKVRISALQIAKQFLKLQKSVKRLLRIAKLITLFCKMLHYVVRRYTTL